MTAPEAAVWCQSPLLLAAVLPSGALAGLLLARGVGRLLPPPPPGAPKTGRWPLAARVAPAVMAAATAAVWWWEIRMLGQIPAAVAGVDCVVLWLRLAAHLILASLLAAAAWVDLEERVIPDAITVPGVLAGLAWNALLPATLLPVGRTVSRSFAPPLIEPDVLGGFGPLHDVGLPGWLCGPAGLALMAAIFAVWWWFGMPPARPDGRPDAPADPRLIRLGLIVAAAGGFGLTIAWLAGGDHWAGLVTAMLGLLVAAGIIWATRAGASRALGREAMGFGDVTLMAMAGSWLGWQACLLACLLAVFIGLIHGVTQLLRHSESELPFGPSLCLGLGLVVIAWRPIWTASAPQFERPLEMGLVVAVVIVMTALTLWAWSRLRGGFQA
jgi:leader peptidase (prepilin peptidase)/N-methyltransferase